MAPLDYRSVHSQVLRCASERASTTDQLGDLLDPLPGDARPLFHRQWVISGFQFKSRDQPDRTGVYQGFQVKRLGIAGKRGGEPAKIGWLMRSCLVVPQRERPGEIRLAQRDPHRIDEEFLGSLDGKFQMSSDKGRRLIDDAQVWVSSPRSACSSAESVSHRSGADVP